MEVRVFPSRCQGTVQAPPSKSAAHRVLLAAGLARGETLARPLAWSQDILATIDCLRVLGTQVETGEDWARVTGRGGPHADGPFSLPCRESGSTLRFLIPLCALTGREATLTGSPRLLERPQGVYRDLFAAQGLPFRQEAAGITLRGPLRAGVYRLRGDVSSQFVTGLLYALPLLPGDSRLELLPPVESRSYIQMTLDMLARFGIEASWEDAHTLSIPGRQAYRALGEAAVEGDYSQAAFWGALGALNGPIRCTGLRPDSFQGDKVFLSHLAAFGARVEPLPDGFAAAPAPLTGGEIDLADCPDLGPILTALAVFCQGESRICHAGRLRLKESDRIAAMEEELRRMGARLSSTEDEIRITGGGTLEGGCTVSCHNDHRIAMSLAVAATCCRRPVTITGAQAVNKSYPAFWEDLSSTGARVEKQAED